MASPGVKPVILGVTAYALACASILAFWLPAGAVLEVVVLTTIAWAVVLVWSIVATPAPRYRILWVVGSVALAKDAIVASVTWFLWSMRGFAP
jgi:hypothetical protein